MVAFTDARIYAKGTCSAIASDPVTGEILYYSNKFQTGNVRTSNTAGEIRAGLGNNIAAIIPTDGTVTVDFTAADCNLWAKMANVGGSLGYNAIVPKAQLVTATSSTLTISVTDGVPAAQYGYSTPFCYVQEVGASSAMSAGGDPYPVSSAGLISGFTATSGKQYKVWYWVSQANAQLGTIHALIDPKVVHFVAQIACYKNNSGNLNNSTRCGWLYVVIPRLKLGGNGGINGDQSTPDTTGMSGTAIAYDNDVIVANTMDCALPDVAYYIYVPDDKSENITGVQVMEGGVSVVKSTTAQLPIRLVLANKELVAPSTYASGFTCTLSSAPAGTSITNAGVITAGSTAGSCTGTVTYTKADSSTVSCDFVLEVTDT